MEWAKVAYSSNFQELQVARSRVNELNDFFRSRYKIWLKEQAPATNGGPSLEALEVLEASPSEHPSSSSVVSSIPEPTTTTAAAAPVRDEVVVVAERLVVKKAAAQKFLAECRRQAPDSTVDDILAVIDEADKSINRRVVKNPTGVLLETVPLKLAAYKKRAAPPKPYVSDVERDLNSARLILASENDPTVPEDLKQWARDLVGKQAKGASGED
jgi:hypothetical protein